LDQVLVTREQRLAPLDGRRRRFETASAVALVGVAAAMLARAGTGGADWPVVICLAAMLALLSRVEFEVGTGVLVPTQLAFIPLVFLAPHGVVVAATIAGYVAGGVAGPGPPARRLVLLVSSCWFSVGPALVVLALGTGGTASRQTLVWALAIAAQIAVDYVNWALNERLAGDRRLPRAADAAWLYAFDLLLAPIGLCAVLAAPAARFAFVLPASVVGLLALHRRERAARFSSLEELSHAYRGTALLLADVIEADDAYTGEHSAGVVGLARAVAVELGLDSARRFHDVEMAALLHDIGKIHVQNEILNKPGALTPDEWAVMRRHAEVGAEMLERVGGALAAVAPSVRHHHERWDGSGYPSGLAGEEIPLVARIIAVCDAYNAMTTDRPYRRALGRAAALAELDRCAGGQFDPAVVRALHAIVGAGAAKRAA
jgi:putative nucleotidyltransferase with HDIG domain